MESTLFTALSNNEEANLSGGGNANGGNGGRGGRGGRGGDSTATGGVFIGTAGPINGSPLNGGTTTSGTGGAGGAGGAGAAGAAGGTSNG
ncbi:hypothetical protein [Nostoc commune]|uniref:hypothetical protein n=1 Tax=Nostoc commune TaxID=1178 RepID=UPI002072C0F9|nr:hypothetical protein [Nostoc commune]